MADVSPLLDYVNRQMELTKEEQDIFASLLSVKKVKRKQFICQPGFVSKQRNYVVKGALRAYIIGNDGQEHTISLAIEDWFIGDAGSYISQEPGTLFVEALEDSILIQMSYDDELLLLEKIPKFHSYFRIRAQRTAVNIQKRVLSNISQTAEQRYEEFAKRYPQLMERFPLYIIASYLLTWE
jgi:CRP/FNR family transcriptional regulator, anaerobic regulatory protein